MRLFHVLGEFLFTTKEMEQDFYHQKSNTQVASGNKGILGKLKIECRHSLVQNLRFKT